MTDPITLLELINIISDGSPEQQLLLAEKLGPMFDSRQSTKSRQELHPRIQVSSAEIDSLDDGTEVWGGPSRFPVVDFLGASGYIDRYDRNTAHIRTAGGATDCIADFVVSACWADEVTALRGIEGQAFQSLTGCDFWVFSTFQGAATDALARLPNNAVIAICPGIYDESVVVDSQVQVIGLGDFNNVLVDSYLTGTPTHAQIPFIRGAAGTTVEFSSVPAGSQSSIKNVAVRALAGQSGITSPGNHALSVEHCYFDGSSTGVGITAGAACRRIVDCLFDDLGTGIDTTANGNYFLVSRNTFSNCVTDVIVGGNETHCQGNLSNGATTCFQYASAISRSVIDGNTFTSAGTFLAGSTANIQARNIVRNNHGGFSTNFANFASISSSSTGPLLIEGNSASGGTTDVPIVYPTVVGMTIIDRNNEFDGVGGVLSAYRTNTPGFNSISNHNLVELATGGSWGTVAPLDVEHIAGFKGWPFYITDDSPVTLAWVAFSIAWDGVEVDYAANAGTILTANVTNYVYASASAVVINTTGFPAYTTTPHVKLCEIVTPVGNNTITSFIRYGAIWRAQTVSGIGGAPDTADYLVGTAQAGLSAEIVVGTTPGGELGGTWASPTVDATHSGSAHQTNSYVQYVFFPDAAPAAVIVAGDQQGPIHHSGPAAETADLLYVDAETAPGASGLPVTIQYADTNDLDTAASWTTIATYTLSSEKSNQQASMTNATIPANRLLRCNIGTIVGSPADGTFTLRVKRPLTT